ncbi:TPR-like protein [Aspergillus ambiguus]|uniref:TPR-like protein n=1 Tax=Aspergillus ambiguus TaxID=176160 RepID=UPI003CCE086E
MSGLEVIGGISAVIGLVDASIKIYKSARNDMKLSEAFKAVGRQLPIIRDTLQICKSNLEPKKHHMPTDVCEALEKIVDACDEKAGSLRGIFEKVIPGENDTWETRYQKVIRRLGKGNKVEELMISITKDVQLLVNHHAVNSANPERNAELERILKEMESVRSSLPEEEKSAMTFNSGGGQMTTYVHRGGGPQVHNSAPVENQYFGSVTFKQKDYFRFQRPFGLCLGQAPYIDSGLFVGRDPELDKIEIILKTGDSSGEQRRLVLGGIGGIGKTQLAIAYAQRHRNIYSSVFWLNAASESALKDSFRLMAELIFDVQDPGVLQGDQVLVYVHQWLSDTKNTRWLLIFDNYDEPDHFKIDKYYPHASHGFIIITTRRPALVAGRSFQIQPLRDINASLEILRTRSKRESVKSDPDAKRLAERLEGFPLALATAGAFLQRSTFTFERYLQEYEKRWSIDPRRPPQLQEYQDRTLYTTWDISYTRLEGEDPDAAKLLGLLAYFDNQKLWFELLRAGLTDNSPQWLQEVMKDDIAFENIMSILTEYCFLELQSAAKSWSMHPCVHDWTLAALNRHIDPQQYWYAFDCVAASINRADWNSFELPSYSRLGAHATRLIHQSFHKDDLIYNIAPYRLAKAFYIAQLLQMQLQLVGAEQMYLQTISGYEKALGRDHTKTLDTVIALGVVYQRQGKMEDAEEMYQRALAGYKWKRGPVYVSRFHVLNNLGNLYRDQGMKKKAEEAYEQALIGTEKLLGPDDRSTLDTINNLGLLYCDQGKLQEAQDMYQRALEGKEKVLTPCHPSTLDTVNNIGILYTVQGKLKEAGEMFQRALAGYERTLGPNHISTIRTANNLEILYQKQGKMEEVEWIGQQFLGSHGKALGPDHRST